MSDFHGHRDVTKARKPYKCDECLHPIEVGTPYRYRFGKQDGDPYDLHVHIECENWAIRVMCCDDGRALLCDADPLDEEWDELVASIRANPPGDELMDRLPNVWRGVVLQALSIPTKDLTP